MIALVKHNTNAIDT